MHRTIPGGTGDRGDGGEARSAHVFLRLAHNRQPLVLEQLGARVVGVEAARDALQDAVGADAESAAAELPEQLLERGVLVSPGTYFGPSGAGYVRFALVPTLEECERAAAILEDL